MRIAWTGSIGCVLLWSAALAPAEGGEIAHCRSGVEPVDVLARGEAALGTDCWPGVVPAGSLPTQPGPVFCTIVNGGPSTAESLPNGWADEFQHGLSFADFDGTPYLLFDELGGAFDTIHWRHNGHWMVDIAPESPTSPSPPTFGAAMLRPNRSFAFEEGRLTVETVFAAGHPDYANPPTTAWGEIVITTSPEPAGAPYASVYGYEYFPNHYTLGCRMQSNGTAICALFDDSDRTGPGGGRIWEMSFFQVVGQSSYGGYPEVGGFRFCLPGQPDTFCQDRFRIEFGETSITWWVNGVLYFQQTGVPPLPAELTQGPVYVYFASITNRSDYDVIRFHWDDIFINGGNPLIFADDFESGGTAAWSSTAP
jgi:hypothetical protein